MRGNPNCKACKGTGVVTQEHDYCSEQVACQCVEPPAKVLITLDEHNVERSRQIYSPKVVGNGIGCPSCGGELYDADEILLMSHPPQRRVLCKTCGWKGTRVT